MSRPATLLEAVASPRDATVSNASETPQLCFDYGGVAVAYGSDTEPWLAAVADRFDGFATQRESDFTIEYRVDDRPAAPPADLEVARWVSLGRVAEDGRLVFAGPSFSATADLAARRATVVGPLATYPLDLMMRDLLPLLVGDGVILHGAALTDGGRAWACCGPSGCGKSTLARLLPERALCDELTLIEPSDGALRVRSLPYWTARPGTAPLAGVYLLSHGREAARVPLAPEEALRELVPQTVWPALSQAATGRCFSSLCRLVEQVPVWRLAFAPTRDVWETISREDRPWR